MAHLFLIRHQESKQKAINFYTVFVVVPLIVVFFCYNCFIKFNYTNVIFA